MNATTAANSLCLADEIALLAAQVDVGMHRLLTCIRRFDQSEEWARHGARSCAEWLTPAGAEIAPVPDIPLVPRPGLSSVDDPDVNLCGWDGERIDYDAAVDALCAA